MLSTLEPLVQKKCRWNLRKRKNWYCNCYILYHLIIEHSTGKLLIRRSSTDLGHSELYVRPQKIVNPHFWLINSQEMSHSSQIPWNFIPWDIAWQTGGYPIKITPQTVEFASCFTWCEGQRRTTSAEAYLPAASWDSTPSHPLDGFALKT